MLTVHDFCNACSDSTEVKLMFFDNFTQEFITTIILQDAKIGCKGLSACFEYGTIEALYASASIIVCSVYVLNA